MMLNRYFVIRFNDLKESVQQNIINSMELKGANGTNTDALKKQSDNVDKAWCELGIEVVPGLVK